jgi:hypothetical protein
MNYKTYQMKTIFNRGLILLLLIVAASCNNDHKKAAKAKAKTIVFRGLYSFGPEIKSFKDCERGRSIGRRQLGQAGVAVLAA